jgi:hypothetical protein
MNHFLRIYRLRPGQCTTCFYTVLLLTVLLLTTTVSLAQTTNTWTGTTSTNWNTATNWSLSRVPLATDNAVIVTATNQPVLSTAASASTVEVQSGASLSISSAGSLTLNGSKLVSPLTMAFLNGGTVNNSGQLVIGNLSTANVGLFGIVNDALFFNNAGGSIAIDRTISTGLVNRAGHFTNSARIAIGAVASVGLNGIFNDALFDNNLGGIITIDQSSQFGLSNNTGRSFTNSATITIGAVAAVGKFGINNFGLFANDPGGSIAIDRASDAGLSNGSGFSNNPITFTNSATITIGAVAAVGSNGIQSSATFANTGCGALINIVANAVILNLATFSNTGRIIENASGNSGISTNTGLVQNLNGGNFTIGTNTGVLTTIPGSLPTITATPSGTPAALTITQGESATLTASGALSYNWSSGPTNTSTISVSVAGPYSVTGSIGSCFSTTTVTLIVRAAPPSITTQPASASTVCEGASVLVTVGVSGSISGYQWRKGGSPVAGQTGPTLSLGNVQLSDAGVYSLSLTGPTGSTTSSGFTLAVNPLPIVTLLVSNSLTVQGPGVATITLPANTTATIFQALGGNLYERLIILDRINGYEVRQVDSNTTGIFTITRPGFFTLTVTGAGGCSRTVQGVVQAP